MKKISIVYEKLDENFNGWALNGLVDKNTVNENYCPPSPYAKQIFDIILNPETPNNYNPFFGRNKYSNHYTIKTVDQLEENEQYIYIVNIFHMDVFLNALKFISISSRVLEDIRKGNAYLLLCYPNEGNLWYHKDKFSEMIINLNLPKNNILVMHADFNVKKFFNCPFKYVPVNIFPWWLMIFSNDYDKPIDYIPNKLFVSYNREVRIDRAHLILGYKNNNLLDSGYVSCGHIYSSPLFNHEEIKFLKSIEGMSPDNLQISGPDRVNPSSILNPEHSINSFVTITSETEAREDEIVYFTEKTFKPILLGHPFMLLGGRHQLAKLKEFGYKTFDKWWDESYDNEVGYKNRISKIINNLLVLRNKSQDELVSIRKDMLDVLSYNQKLFLNTIHGVSDDDLCVLAILDNLKNDVLN